MRSVTVIIVNYRTPDLTLVAAASAIQAGTDGVLVVDNSAPDQGLGRLARQPSVDIVDLQRNMGFGAAANAGSRKAPGESLLFLNSDAEIASGGIQALKSALANWEGRAIVGPRLVSPNGTVQRSAGLLPRPSDLVVRALGLHAIAQRSALVPVIGGLVRRSRWARDYASAVTASGPIETAMVSGACFAIGREAFEELGGFDERFFMYFEDADLCRRAAAAGMPIRYVPAAVVTHIGGASSSEDYHFGPLHARSMRQYLGKWYGPGGSALAIVLLWLRAVGFSLALRPAARRAWRALWAAVRDEDPRR